MQKQHSEEKGTNKVVFTEFIKADIDYIKENANFTEEQEKIFDLLLTGKYIDVGIANQLGLRNNTYYKIKKQIVKKILRILY